MSKQQIAQDNYVNVIVRDEREKIASERPVVFENDRLERLYEFPDGAVVRYEWRDASVGGFNHRFSLIAPPDPNPNNLVTGVITEIHYQKT
jgi:hypothetical protein